MSSDSLASRIQALQTELATSLDGQLTTLGDALAQIDQTSGRLEGVSEKLAELVALRMSQLATVLAAGEQRARRLIATELEIERQRADTARTESQVVMVEREARATRVRADSVRNALDKHTTKKEQAQEQFRKLKDQVESAKVGLDAQREKLVVLQREADQVSQENDSLEAKKKALQENIARMRALTEANMHTISGLTAQMADVAAGSGE